MNLKALNELNRCLAPSIALHNVRSVCGSGGNGNGNGTETDAQRENENVKCRSWQIRCLRDFTDPYLKCSSEPDWCFTDAGFHS